MQVRVEGSGVTRRPVCPAPGLVQLITETETLRKIQVKHGHGVTGSLKDSTISEWLKVQNPTELELQKVTGRTVVRLYILLIIDFNRRSIEKFDRSVQLCMIIINHFRRFFDI